MYELEFLPLALADMEEIVRYIADDLSSPAAAERLAEEMIEAAESIRTFPYACASYIPVRPLKHEYRKLRVKRYILFFWITEETKKITIARAVYSGRNLSAVLE